MRALALPPSTDPFAWRALFEALVSRYGPETAEERFLALKDGTDEDLIAWRNLGRGRAA